MVWHGSELVRHRHIPKETSRLGTSKRSSIGQWKGVASPRVRLVKATLLVGEYWPFGGGFLSLEKYRQSLASPLAKRAESKRRGDVVETYADISPTQTDSSRVAYFARSTPRQPSSFDGLFSDTPCESAPRRKRETRRAPAADWRIEGRSVAAARKKRRSSNWFRDIHLIRADVARAERPVGQYFPSSLSGNREGWSRERAEYRQ